MKHLLSALAFLSAFAVSGCAGLRPLADQETIEFELNGRIATRVKEEAAAGIVAWRHSKASDELLITTPVGSSVARIVRTGNEVVLTTAEPRDYRANDAEALTEQVLGFRLPLAGLTEWVRGKAVEGSQATVVRDGQGRISGLDQNGWHVEYQEYRPDGLPTRLKLTYPGIEIRLAIHDWKLGPQPR